MFVVTMLPSVSSGPRLGLKGSCFSVPLKTLVLNEMFQPVPLDLEGETGGYHLQ